MAMRCKSSEGRCAHRPSDDLQRIAMLRPLQRSGVERIAHQRIAQRRQQTIGKTRRSDAQVLPRQAAGVLNRRRRPGVDDQ